MLFWTDPPGGSDPSKAFQGYYGDKAATEKKIVRDVLVKGDMYFRTGDMIRQEHDGARMFTYFEDRMGDTFRWKGENVSTMVRSNSPPFFCVDLTFDRKLGQSSVLIPVSPMPTFTASISPITMVEQECAPSPLTTITAPISVHYLDIFIQSYRDMLFHFSFG